MTPSDFCVWLKGFLAVDRTTKNLPKKDVDQIKEKLEETSAYQVYITNPTYTDGITFKPSHDEVWNPGYNKEVSDYGKITCESGPCISG